MSRCRLAALLISLAATAGCLTPPMGEAIKDQLDVTFGPTTAARRPGTVGTLSAFDRDSSLPRRIWYLDPIARIYHERRTNTFVVRDDTRGSWVAVSREGAFAADFEAARARLLVDGAPPEVEKCLDGIQDLEPAWRGT